MFGFALFGAAEVLDNANARKPAATGARQAEAIAIAGGLLSFVFANHTSIF